MARSNATVDTNSIEYVGTIVSAAPFSISAWFNPTDVTGIHSIFTITHSSNNGIYFQLLARGDTAGDPLQVIINDNVSGAVTANSTAGYSANAPNHGVAVFASTTSRSVYLNGGNKASSVTSCNPTGLTHTTIGGRAFGGTNHNTSLKGAVWEVGLWDVALTDADAAAIATGVSPRMVQPGNLVAYWPLFGNDSPEPDLVGGIAMTVTGFTKSDHGRMYYPSGLILPEDTAAAPPTPGAVIFRRTRGHLGTRIGSRQAA